ncbi:MAG: P-II family nitrogen regulator [Nitrospinota bacterium]|nr:P-II family nitrogen regulator [Nitrospinota bacterium]
MKFNLVFTICPADKTQEVVGAAKAAGATGATIVHVRGTGSNEAKTFFGLTLDKPQEAFITLVEKRTCQKILKAIYDAGDMQHPGNGISFSLPIESVVGLESQLSTLKKEAEEYL